MEPILDAEVASHFRYPASHGFLVTAQAFQAKGQLMPDLVRDDLVIGVLHHEADLLGLVPVRNLFQRNAPEQNFAGAFAVGGEDGFQLPQEGTLAAAGLAAESNKFSLLNRQTDIFQTVLSLGGSVGKRQILDLEMCHCMASFMCSAVGNNRNAA